MAGRMEHAGACVSHMCDDVDKSQRVHELHRSSAVAFQSEGNHSTRSAGQVFLSQLVVLVVGEPAVVHPCHPLVVVQEFRYLLCVLAMLRHAQVQRLQSQVEQEGVLRRWYRTEVAHELCHQFRDIRHFSERLRVGEPVIRLVGRGQSGELWQRRMLRVERILSLMCTGIPVEVSAINDTSTHLRGVSVHVFRGRVRHDVSPPFEGSAVDGCREGVIDNQGHTVLVSYACKLLDV